MMPTVDSCGDGDGRPGRLVDDEGRIWTCRWSCWATPQQIKHMIGRGRRIVVRRPGEPIAWLAPDEARTLWQRIRSHIEVPGTSGARPDVDGLTYSAHIWRNGARRLLCIEVRC